MSSGNDIYVVFTSDRGNWWSRFLHPDVKHCYVVRPTGGQCIVHAKTTGKTDLFNIKAENGIIESSYIILGYKQAEASQSLFMLNTCVGHTKHLLGIKKPFIWTPYQLLKYMRKKNG